MARTGFKKRMTRLICFLWMLLCGYPVYAQVGVRSASEISNDTINWMKKVADWQLTQSSWDISVSWERGALHAGLMACYEATKDEKYLNMCRQWAEKFNWQLGWGTSPHADNWACAQAYMELYFLDGQDEPIRYAQFKTANDLLVTDPTYFECNAVTSNINETWWWCDALFMAPPGMVRLSRATQDTDYISLMQMMWAETQDCLYDTMDHLFFRDIDYLPPYNYNGEKVFWSRGNGWVLAGTARMLQYLPLGDPHRSDYITLLQEMSAKLADIQMEDGYWHSDLLSPEHYDNPETSGTGFFTFGIGWGVNNGFLDEATYWPTVEAGWEALKAAVQSDGLLGWVQPVGEDPGSTSATTTDVFGVGAYLLAGSEVLKYRLAHDPNSIEYFESYLTDTALQTAWGDGDTNGTTSQVTLGDYGDNFMELTYHNDQPPYRSETDYTFSAPWNFARNELHYLSILVRGNPANAAEKIYMRLEDAGGDSAVQIMADPNVVQTAEWMELAFPLADFTDIDLEQITRLTIGIGWPDAALPKGQGTLRIDNIRLSPAECTLGREDIVSDCRLNLLDFAVLASQWLDEYSQLVDPVNPGTADLVAYWPLDNHYNDVTGNSYDAVSGGDPIFDTGHIGQSVYFNGADFFSYLECQNSTGLDLNENLTISVWIKSAGLDDQWASVVAKGVNAWRVIRNSYSDAISFHFNAAGGGEYQANGSTPVLDRQWHHVMAVYDGSEIRLYVDGQLDAAGAAGPVNTSDDPVYIGSRVNNTWNRNWIGNIDDVRIYNTALNGNNLLYLAEKESYAHVPDPPRSTDLILDGKINLHDLQKLLEKWTQRSYWP